MAVLVNLEGAPRAGGATRRAVPALVLFAVVCITLFGAGRFGSPVGGGSVTTAKASSSGSNEALSTQMKQIMMDSHNVSFAAWRMQDGQPAGHAGGSLGLIFAG